MVPSSSADVEASRFAARYVLLAVKLAVGVMFGKVVVRPLAR